MKKLGLINRLLPFTAIVMLACTGLYLSCTQPSTPDNTASQQPSNGTGASDGTEDANGTGVSDGSGNSGGSGGSENPGGSGGTPSGDLYYYYAEEGDTVWKKYDIGTIPSNARFYSWGVVANTYLGPIWVTTDGTIYGITVRFDAQSNPTYYYGSPSWAPPAVPSDAVFFTGDNSRNGFFFYMNAAGDIFQIDPYSYKTAWTKVEKFSAGSSVVKAFYCYDQNFFVIKTDGSIREYNHYNYSWIDPYDNLGPKTWPTTARAVSGERWAYLGQDGKSYAYDTKTKSYNQTAMSGPVVPSTAKFWITIGSQQLYQPEVSILKGGHAYVGP